MFGDQLGNYVHLYERDCSIQRRHQKVVEEAPSNLNESIRQSIYKSAVDAAKAVGYYNAGTVEFIFDLDSNKHYFMEMNTRLQVEHPISEMITGFDFVEWQLLVASGFPLPKKQSEIEKKGNGIEVRIYAEDPFNNFLPGNGTLKYFKEPAAHEGVRIETGVREKDTISTFYDPMIAKLITYGKTRSESIDLMKKALRDYKIVGFNNNLKFLKRVFENPIFQQGDYDTGFIEQNIQTLLHRESNVDVFDLVTAVVARNLSKSSGLALPSDLVNFRNVKSITETHKITVHDTSIVKDLHFSVEVEKKGAKRGVVTLEGKHYTYEVQAFTSNLLTIVINGQIRKQEYFVENNFVHVFNHEGDQFGFRFESDEMKAFEKNQGANDKSAKSPMPGTVTKIYHKPGTVIKKGDSIIAMEAMKMELVIKAQFDCKIAKINVGENEFVEAGKVLVELELP